MANSKKPKNDLNEIVKLAKNVSTTVSKAKKTAKKSTSTSKSKSTTAKNSTSTKKKSNQTPPSGGGDGSTATVVSSNKSTAFKVFVVILVLILVAILVYGYFEGWFDFIFVPVEPIVDGELSIHFLELGNKYSGDSIFIKAGEVDILVDAGSRQSSASTIKSYIDQYCTDGILEYVIATHADQDHIAAFVGTTTAKGIFDSYVCEVIIDFPQTNKSTAIYNNYVAKRDAEVDSGAKHYTALECYNNENGASRVIELTEGIELEILYHEFYETYSSDENNYSVCFVINQGSRSFLFTGDLEKEGEQSLVENNNLPKVELFKAGHHGSKTSSNKVLLDVIQPKIVVVCCCAGSAEYTSNVENQFPTQDMINRVAVYTAAVYVTTLSVDDSFTSMNGNIKIISNAGEGVTVDCSNNNLKLYQTEWFKNYRVMPMEWAGLQ